MGKKLVAAVAAALLVLVLTPVSAGAETPPADVDCDLLASTLITIDVEFDLSNLGSVGELLSALLTNPTSFNSFNNIVFAFSGNAISFASGPELVSTLGSCGLMPLLVDLIDG